MEANGYTYPSTHAKVRSEVIEDHFQLFLKNAGMSNKKIDLISDSVLKKELESVAIYATENGERIAEVEFSVDWDEHERMISKYGIMFDTDIPGFEDGLAPEATLAVRRMIQKAKKHNWTIHSWIRISSSIDNSSSHYEAICKKLGYGASVEPWKRKPTEMSRKVQDMEEASVAQRLADYEL